MWICFHRLERDGFLNRPYPQCWVVRESRGVGGITVDGKALLAMIWWIFPWLPFPCNINKQRSEFQINFKCASLTFGQLETERRTWKTKHTAKMVESLPVVQFVFYIWWMFFIFFMCLLFFFIFIILIIMVFRLDLHLLSHLDIPFDVMAETFADHVNLTYATRSFHLLSFTPHTQVLISDSGHRTQTRS